MYSFPSKAERDILVTNILQLFYNTCFMAFLVMSVSWPGKDGLGFEALCLAALIVMMPIMCCNCTATVLVTRERKPFAFVQFVIRLIPRKRL